MNVGALYRLTKPGVTYGNLITTIAAYLFAASGTIDWFVFAGLTFGTWCIIASACVINNYLDQDIDSVMTRTKKRPLMTGEVTGLQAIIFGALLGIVGVATLAVYTNKWVVGIGVVGWIIYVWLYGAFGKRKSVHGTLIGAISGAAPIWAGWLAVNPGVDVIGVLLFLVLFFWQMPEFYAISIFRKDEYRAAKVPVSAVVRGVPTTIRHIVFFTILTVFCALLLTLDPLVHTITAANLTIVSTGWLYVASKGLFTKDAIQWARGEFHFSLVFLIVFSVAISVNPYLP